MTDLKNASSCPHFENCSDMVYLKWDNIANTFCKTGWMRQKFGTKVSD